MLYFKHDVEAFKNSKIQALRIEFGGAAIDAYYALIELIYQSETDLVFGVNLPDSKSLAYWLCLDWETLESYIAKMGEIGLLAVDCDDDGNYVLSSVRANESISDYRSKSETARQNGKKGGRPKSQKTNEKPTENQSETQLVSEETKPKAIKEEEVEEKEEVPKGTSKKKNFQKPTVSEIAAYAAERGSPSFDAERFVDHYESNGWKVGRTPMKDWKAAVRNWLRNDQPKPPPQRGGAPDDRFAKYR